MRSDRCSSFPDSLFPVLNDVNGTVYMICFKYPQKSKSKGVTSEECGASGANHWSHSSAPGLFGGMGSRPSTGFIFTTLNTSNSKSGNLLHLSFLMSSVECVRKWNTAYILLYIIF
jgi:hypothetical protein